MSTRTRELLRATGAAGLLAALVIGIPGTLAVTVGNPLPHTLPHWDDLTAALRGDQPVADTVWINLLAALVWLAWARLTVGVVIEAITTVQHHPRSLDVRAGAVQRSIGTLVATAALILTLHHRPAIDTVALPRLIPTAAVTVEPVAATTAPAPTAAPATAGSTWTVGRHDSLWRIAEHTLGDGRRYREIYDLNHGRPQSDGDTLTDPSIIKEGWTLELPADAQLPSAATDATVEPGDTLSGIAQRTLGDANRWPEIAAANTGVAQPDGQALHNPNLIRPGWHLIVPEPATDPAPSPAPPPPAEPPPPGPAPAAVPPPAVNMPDTQPALEPSTSAGPTTAPDTASSRDANGAHGGTDDTIGTVGLFGLTPVTAAAIVLAVRRRRRTRLAYRTPQQTIPAAAPADQSTERELRAVADEDAAAWIDATTRLLSRVLRDHHPRPAPVLLRTGSRGVEILLDTVCAPDPEWFTSDDGGRTWQLRPDLDLDALRSVIDGESPATPAMVTIGTTREGPVLADLEHCAVLAVDGDPARVRAFLNALTIELAHASWADAVPMLVDDTLPGCNLERVRPITATTAIDALDQNARATGGALPDGTNTLEARTAADATELWPPTIVITATPPTDPGKLVALPAHAGVAAVTAGPVPAAPWRLSIDPDGRAQLYPLDLVFVAAGIDDDAVAATSALLTDAHDDQDTIVTPEPAAAEADQHERAPVASSGNGHHPRVEDTIARILTPLPVEVRVLQPAPTVDGWHTDDPVRAKSTEMVVYLAVHDQPVRTDRLWHDLWSTDVAYATFKNAVTRTRTALGADSTGIRHLREAVDGTYRLSAEVGCDWTRFQELTVAAGTAPDHEAVELLTAGLRLVTGRPFSAVPKGHYGWAEVDGTVTAIEVAVADAAHRLGQLALGRHDADLASWAAGQGLLATPEQLSLFETEMLARGIAGDIGGIKRAYTAAQRVVCDVDALDSVPPRTVDAYERAMRTAHSDRAAS
jgi:hypothetical protein